MKTLLSVRNLFLLLIGLAIGTSCNNAQKSLNMGHFDRAFNIALRKLQKKPRKQKFIPILEESFKKTRKAKLDQISFLKKDGQPDRWDEIFSIYNVLKRQQSQVNALPRLYYEAESRFIDFPNTNFNAEIVKSKKNAAEYFYAHGQKLLKRGGKENARQAYDEFMSIKEFYADYKDVNKKIQQAKDAGTSMVNFKMVNKAHVALPGGFEKELKKISLEDLNRLWLTYHTNPRKGVKYDYSIIVKLKVIDVAPESSKEIHYTDEKRVRDGFKYVLDNKGNVKKDSLGNDLKEPKFKIIKCNVVEIQQFKSARVAGNIDYFNNNTKQLIKTFPITADAIFEHFAARTVSGNVKALSQKSKEKLKRKPLPFPSDFDLLLDAGHTLKDMIKEIIWANKRVLN
ncbi:hypothetical protein JYU23_00360 [bacterium AH-315-C07]|nr:hypothetical protein [bacterium AH-315-C07]